MTYREFVVPADEEILDALGVESESVEGEPSARFIRVAVGAKDVVLFSYDVVGRSVRCRWLHDGRKILDLFRESATQMTVTSGHGEAWIVVRFETDPLAGQLKVRVAPEVCIEDELLIH
jgi:hypothetical protein